MDRLPRAFLREHREDSAVASASISIRARRAGAAPSAMKTRQAEGEAQTAHGRAPARAPLRSRKSAPVATNRRMRARCRLPPAGERQGHDGRFDFNGFGSRAPGRVRAAGRDERSVMASGVVRGAVKPPIISVEGLLRAADASNNRRIVFVERRL